MLKIISLKYITMNTKEIKQETSEFVQRNKDGYFNATALIKYYNKISGQNKQIGRYKFNLSTNVLVEQLKSEGILNPIISGSGSGEASGTWMHATVFFDFAMWLSVDFKSKVIDYVTNGLLDDRDDSGDYYNQMCAQIVETYVAIFGIKPPSKMFIEEGNRIKALVTDKGRNDMTEQELRQLTYLQKVNANLISKGIGKAARIKRLEEAAEIKI